MNLIKALKHFRNWLSLPPKCPWHGLAHLFASRTWNHGEVSVSYKCQIQDCTWMSKDWREKMKAIYPITGNSMNKELLKDWMSEREDYLAGKCTCDNWPCNKKH